MGGVASKRVKARLGESPDFDSACDSAYTHCLSLTQHAFHGVFPYQLPTAATHIHHTVSTTQFPLIHRWVPSPPTRSQIDMALRVITRHQQSRERRYELGLEKDPELLGQSQFKEWAVELFGEAVVSSAGKAVLTRVPMGVAGITGIGAATRSGREVVGTAIGVYVLGVAAWIYIGFSVTKRKIRLANLHGQLRPDEDNVWEEVSRKMLPAGAPLPDEEQLDYSIVVEYDGRPLSYDVAQVDPVEIDSLSIRTTSVVSASIYRSRQ